jgi:L-histidine N-alpha-methyltransferase
VEFGAHLMTSIRATTNVDDSEAVRRREMRADIRDTLSRTPRELSPKYFYDERGSELFEEITRVPEYYLTRAEREILTTRARAIATTVQPATLVELGAGSALKTRIILDAMGAREQAVTYVPLDVSAEFLEQTRRSLVVEYPKLRVEPVVADITATLGIPQSVTGPVLFAFLGSTIGNFDWPSAVGLLRRVRAHMKPNDRLLLGTDLRKDPAVLSAAYNDAAGVTAEFNKNILRVVNHALDANFNVDAFEHVAFYNVEAHRIEMHLRANGAQVICIPGVMELHLADGEMLRTELSHKYDRASVDALAGAARLSVVEWFTDDATRFALSLLGPAT